MISVRQQCLFPSEIRSCHSICLKPRECDDRDQQRIYVIDGRKQTTNRRTNRIEMKNSEIMNDNELVHERPFDYLCQLESEEECFLC
jgi:hypothetical protein